MSTPGDARQKAMDVNRSLRTIKTELEKLLELGAMTDDEFNGIHDQLPQEWSLRGGPPATAARKQAAPAQAEQAEQATQAAQAAQHPPLPVRNNSSQPAAAAAAVAEPAQPEAHGEVALGYASAKYKYDAPNEGDLAFERGDAIAVYNKINDDWWRGRNVRSGSTGIFPRQYIKPDDALADLERHNQLDAPPSGPPPARSARSAAHDYADADRQANNGSAPPAYQDAYPAQAQTQQHYGDAKYDQPYYASQPPQHQPYGQAAYGQPGYVQPVYAQQPPYYGGGPSHEQAQQQAQQQQQQQQQQPQGDQKLKSSGKKIGGKLGNAFVTGVGFAAGAELVGAIL